MHFVIGMRWSLGLSLLVGVEEKEGKKRVRERVHRRVRKRNKVIKKRWWWTGGVLLLEREI